MTELLRKLKDDAAPLARPAVPPDALAELIGLVRDGSLSGSTAKDVFETMWRTGERARSIVARDGLAQVSDEAAIAAAVAQVIAASPEQLSTYRGGKTSAFGWFVGQVIRKMGGKANPQVVQRLLKQALDGN
jgi:aspartyl-tRNA(Asn)/glutamyl-tRNA(Gln) amidotransferase subunit B